jgi:EAL domain-containing protein (putative c-di-GMP-specific phosphodiesterase class I)
MVGPSDFIASAESSGLIVPLGLWAIEAACILLARWVLHPPYCDLTLAVNVSALQFQEPDFVSQVLAVLQHTSASA